MLDAFVTGALTSLLFSVGYFLFHYLPHRKYYKETREIEGVSIDHVSADIRGKCSWLGSTYQIEELKSYLSSLVNSKELSEQEAIALFHTYTETKRSFR